MFKGSITPFALGLFLTVLTPFVTIARTKGKKSLVVDYLKEGSIALFTINRPQALNALDLSTLRELSRVMLDFQEDNNLRVGIITGAGRAFSCGADIDETLPFIKENGPWALPPLPWRGLTLTKPLIAAINGLALGGGCELALACDIRIAALDVKIGMTEAKLGLIPGWGGTQRLPRLIPQALAAEMLFTAEPIDAKEAYRIGLVNKVVPRADLINEVSYLANRIAANSPLAVEKVKEAMNRGLNMSLEDGLELENSFEAWIMSTQDYLEGITAFQAKGTPNFQRK